MSAALERWPPHRWARPLSQYRLNLRAERFERTGLRAGRPGRRFGRPLGHHGGVTMRRRLSLQSRRKRPWLSRRSQAGHAACGEEEDGLVADVEPARRWSRSCSARWRRRHRDDQRLARGAFERRAGLQSDEGVDVLAIVAPPGFRRAHACVDDEVGTVDDSRNSAGTRTVAASATGRSVAITAAMRDEPSPQSDRSPSHARDEPPRAPPAPRGHWRLACRAEPHFPQVFAHPGGAGRVVRISRASAATFSGAKRLDQFGTMRLPRPGWPWQRC